MIKTLILCPLVALLAAAPAHADTTTYLNQIHAVGAQHGTTDEFMIGLGGAVCDDLAGGGANVYDVSAAITDTPRSPFTKYESAEIIFISVGSLCPRFMPAIMRQVEGVAM